MAMVWRFIKTAPLTYSWMVVLLITMMVQDKLTGRHWHWLLLRHSTDIYHLSTDPISVLASSLLFIDGKNLVPYLSFGFPLLTMDFSLLNFTAIGHFTAILVGLGYPMTRRRN